LAQNDYYVVIFCGPKNEQKRAERQILLFLIKVSNGEYGLDILLEALEMYCHMSNHRFCLPVTNIRTYEHTVNLQ